MDIEKEAVEKRQIGSDKKEDRTWAWAWCERPARVPGVYFHSLSWWFCLCQNSTFIWLKDFCFVQYLSFINNFGNLQYNGAWKAVEHPVSKNKVRKPIFQQSYSWIKAAKGKWWFTTSFFFKFGLGKSSG